MEVISTFGQWVKVRRKSLDLTQEQLALLVGCSVVTIKKIESNDRRPSRQIAQLLAERLRLSGDQMDTFVRSARGELSLERLSGDTAEVGRLLEESVHLHREVGDPWSLTLSLLEMSRYKLQCADYSGAEQHALEAIRMSDATGSAPIALEGLGILAAICAEQGLNAESLCIVQYILQHPSTKQDTREQVQARIHPIPITGGQEAPVQLTGCDSLLRKRFGVDLPSVLS
ncbi:MAG: helix-turn-helix transcriptional regulator [Chloroflexi bacterium]|nr:helix-turn-helix transcriptional regulator [Chloroflexota bacterium]